MNVDDHISYLRWKLHNAPHSGTLTIDRQRAEELASLLERLRKARDLQQAVDAILGGE